MKLFILIAGLLVLIFVEILRIYFIMPFPGSQEGNTIDVAYFLHNNIVYIRLIGLAVIAYPAVHTFRNGSRTLAIIIGVMLGFYAIVFYMFNDQMQADKMFLQLKKPQFSDAMDNTKVLPEQLVLGITINNESKAYPIEIIGYHHQVRDEVGGEKVMVTYCTVCRTGRVFSPDIDGKASTFRLVGMDHFNAMFEDKETKSWWRQVNGEAITGPLKGKMLREIPSDQMSLAAWVRQHPETKILQPDSIFREAYESLKNYDEGNRTGNLTRKDSLSWNNKSWIVGIQIGMEARAYDWIDLQKSRIVNDVLGDVPVLVILHRDSISFRAFQRAIEGKAYSFQYDNAMNLVDMETGSSWNWNGVCESGTLKGKVLQPIQAYQEYWHSWKTFRPQTSRYLPGQNP